MKARSLRLALGLITLAAVGTTTVWVAQSREEKTVDLDQPLQTSVKSHQKTASQVLPVVSLPTPERSLKLQSIVETGHPLDQNRARYLLAVTALEEKQPETALNWLEGLEEDYPLLGGYILLKRAKAYEMQGEIAKARETWYNIIEKASEEAVIAEAYLQLGRYNSQEWENLLSQFPEHPRAHEVIQNRLEENPNQLQLLRILASYSPEAPGMGAVRDRLVNSYGSQLSPEDWEAIAEGYWESWDYGKAAKAYANAPKTPENLYRHARGLQVSGETRSARQVYLELLNTFPDAERTGLGLRRLAGMVSRREGISYLEQVINRFPKEAPEALSTLAQLLQAANSPQSAQQARQTLLEGYSSSDAAAEYRWEMAEKAAQRGNYSSAIRWAQEITKENRNQSSLAAKAGFWSGKWQQQQGETEKANTSFRQTLSQHPQSYYAWRSAVYLGLPVGDFDTIRDRAPKVIKPATRPLLPAGSDQLKELYQLGQDEAAWTLWQTQKAKLSSLSVEEQFTDGVLQLTQGRYLKGISQISSLQYRDDPDEVSRWQNLRKQSMYWHSLFPFPYNDSILSWSEKRDLNPLLTISLIRQESRFEKEIRSVAGATGLMQIMPSTGEWVAGKVKLSQYSLSNPEDNIKLGTWYLGYTHDRYENHSMLAVASYNAGPGNVAKWVKRYGLKDADEFVEKIPFPETKGYVEAVFGNYWNYLRLYNPEIQEMEKQLAVRDNE